MLIRKIYKFPLLHTKNYTTATAFKWWLNDECLAQLKILGLAKKDVLTNQEKLPANFDCLKQYVEILEESGASVSIHTLVRFREFFYHRNLSDLIKDEILPRDVTSRLLSNLESFPYERNARLPSARGIAQVYKPVQQYHRKKDENTEIAKNWPHNVNEETEKTLQIEQRKILRQYCAWRLSSDLYTIDINLNTYSNSTGIRSLRCFKQSFDILTNTLQLSTQFILKNFFLLSVKPGRLMELVENVKKIGSFDLSQAALLAPRILSKPSSQILQIQAILEEYSVCNDSSSFRVHILTLTPATIRERLRKIAADPDLAPLMKHPRICNLLFYYNKAKSRMEELRKHHFKFFSLNVLIANEPTFQRFLASDSNANRHYWDICTYLAVELAVSKAQISILLKKHPSHSLVSLHNVSDTYHFLLRQNFTTDVILESIQLLLYTKEKVWETLKYIAEDSKLKSRGFDNGFITKASTEFPNRTKFRDKRLILCLYFLEKHHNFTGEGTTRTVEQLY